MKNLLYLGPSWAVQNFEPEQSNNPQTNLCQELQIKAQNLSSLGSTNWENYLVAQKQKSYDAIVWIYCEPILDIETFKISSVNNFLQSENFWDMRAEVNARILEKLNSLGCPVALIGAHSDIVDNNYNNLYTIHPSWQKFLCERINLNISTGWGAEIAHRWFLRRQITPSRNLVDLITETFDAWKKLEENNLFYEVHPNYYGTTLFAKHIQSQLYNWLKTI